ncbi:protein FAM107B isoform X2 [Electrophorus electricus]|uniref:protein FAM107B isoform X2 n=1 Tax=Electrophorus electricus TaxID=8005 RepID=UPI000F0A462B|nr:protein FAM107B isoform X2 [Electrophorus electricus]
MRAAASHPLPIRPSERELKSALCGSDVAGNSPRTQLKARTSNNTFSNSHVFPHGHNRENTDEHNAGESPWNKNNPVKASRSHQELHRELLLAHKKGLVVSTKPELQMVLEKRKREQTQREEGEQGRSPLEQVLLQRQQRQQEKEKEQEEKVREEIQLLEFVRVRQNLRKVHSALQKKTNP